MTSAMSSRSTQHASFVIERTYAAAPERVFHALSDPKAKAVWFVGPEDWTNGGYRMDFRVGGTEHAAGGPKGGPVHSFDATYQDIVPNERIIYTYDMHMDDKRISVSLSTIVLERAEKGTKMTYTEQAVFLDGYDKPSDREHGTNELFDALGRMLAG